MRYKPLDKLPQKQQLKEDGEFASLDSVPGMGAPVLASPGITGSGDITSVTTKRKKIKKFKEFNKDKK